MTDLIPNDGVIRFDGTYSWDTGSSREKGKVKHGSDAYTAYYACRLCKVGLYEVLQTVT
jgi:hypothetical protein